MVLTNLIQNFNCVADYFLENIKFIDLKKIEKYFEKLPADPYLEDNYRFRRLSHVQVINNQVINLPHTPLYQSKEYNPLLGNVVRNYPDINEQLIALEDFQKIVRVFFEFCQLCSKVNEIGIHQIRTTTMSEKIGQPAPEGIHRDGVDLVGIFCVNRKGIKGGITELYKAKNERPIFSKILQPGEFLIFNDHQFFHYTSAIKTTNSEVGIRDVFVFTCPGLLASNH